MEGYYYGILDVYYAIMKTEDTATAAPTYEAPAVLAKSIEVTITPAYREGKLYASNATVRDKKKIDSYGVKLNVVSDGDFVGAQRTVCVERVEGNRIVVRETTGDAK